MTRPTYPGGVPGMVLQPAAAGPSSGTSCGRASTLPGPCTQGEAGGPAVANPGRPESPADWLVSETLVLLPSNDSPVTLSEDAVAGLDPV